MHTDSDPSSSPAGDAALGDFQPLRPRLFALAYRMLGLRADAEDVLQEAWLRWQAADRTALRSSEAWLVTVTTRLALDRLRALRAERERYVGHWLPEPIVEADEAPTPERAAELAGELSVAFLHVLDRLGAAERAAFLMRQVFDWDYDEIAQALGRNEAACRQLVHRASQRLRESRPREGAVPEGAQRELLKRFVEAARSGQREAIQALLHDDVRLTGDGGGVVPSVGRVLHGPLRIASLYWVNWKRLGERAEWRLARVNGEPGLLRLVDGRLESVQAFETDGERILAIYTQRNPYKLASIEPV